MAGRAFQDQARTSVETPSLERGLKEGPGDKGRVRGDRGARRERGHMGLAKDGGFDCERSICTVVARQWQHQTGLKMSVGAGGRDIRWPGGNGMDEGDGFRRRVWGKNNSGGMSDPSVVLFGAANNGRES